MSEAMHICACNSEPVTLHLYRHIETRMMSMTQTWKTRLIGHISAYNEPIMASDWLEESDSFQAGCDLKSASLVK